MYLNLTDISRTFRDPSRAKTPFPPSQPSDCLVYLEEVGIEFGRKELVHFWRPCLAAVRCSPLNEPGSGLEWIECDDSLWSSALHIVSLMLIVRIGAAIVRSSTRSVGASEIRHQLRVVMTFPLPISSDINDGLKPCVFGWQYP